MEISIEKFLKILKDERDSFVLIDVREKEEWDEIRLRDARLIPLGNIEEITNLDPQKRILFFCRSGSRSLAAAEFAVSLGREATSISGGIEEIIRKAPQLLER